MKRRWQIALLLGIVAQFLWTTPGLADNTETLQSIATDIAAAADTYLSASNNRGIDPSWSEATKNDVDSFRKSVERVRAAWAVIQRELDADAARFNQRLKGDDLRPPLSLNEHLKSRGAGFTQYDLDEDDDGNTMIASFPDLRSGDTSLAPEFAFVEALQSAKADYEPVSKIEIANLIDRTIAVKLKYERKLITGFPAMPWEYVLNRHGDRDGPARLQWIWLHPSGGLEVPFEDVGKDDSYVNPVVVLQAGGANYYWLDADHTIGYLGGAVILTLNARDGAEVARWGALCHIGNLASIGVTFRFENGEEVMGFVSSNDVFDKVVSALLPE